MTLSMDAHELDGLVLCGGRSTRMGEDKGVLQYFEAPQTQHCVELLKPYCRRVFLSCREDQAKLAAYQGTPQIHDAYPDTGPMGGIISAMTALPRASWLVVAVDMPFVDKNVIELLLTHRDPKKLITAFHPNNSDFAEPLCTIYESEAYDPLFEAFKKESYSLTKVIKHLDNDDKLSRVTPSNKLCLKNINSKEEFEAIKAELG